MSTEQEREALIDVMVMTRLSDYAATDMSTIHQAVDAILAAGFRRSEVPEPSRDPGWSHPEAVYSPEVFMAIQGLLNEAQGSPMHALRLAVSRQMSEPQGEPSDAAIRNHGGWDMGLQFKSYPEDSAVTAALTAWNTTGGSDRVAMRAALRAAGGVR